jgi:hypothetical protein
VAGPTPTRDGWRAIARTPLLILCEISWRWTFGIALWAVLAYIAFSSLGQVQMTDAEIRLLRELDPRASSYVLLRVMNAIVPVVLRVFIYTLPALVVLWVAAATFGRAATLRALLGPQCRKVRWSAMIGVNLLRVVLLFAAILAFVGSSILVGRMFRGEPEYLGAAILLSLGVNLLVVSLWSLLNWFLTLAPIFVMRDGAGTLAAFAASLGLFRERSGPYMAAAVGLGLVRLALITVVSVLSLIPLGMIGNFPMGAVITAGIAFALVYYALTDAVQIWRIAAYVSLANYEPEIPAPAVAPLPVPVPPQYPTEPPTLPPGGEPESSF